MRPSHVLCSAMFLTTLSSIGCNSLLPVPTTTGATVRGAQDNAPRPRVHVGDERAEKNSDEILDRQEKAALEALNTTLGRAPATPGGPLPDSSSTATIALRNSPVTVRLEPMSDPELRGIFGENFFQLKDSYSERMQQLQRKMMQQKLSKAERKELTRGAKYLPQVADLRNAVLKVSSQVHSSSFNAQQLTLQTMLWTSMLIQSRKATRTEIDADDYALVKRNLERERRADAIAASMMGMLAAFQAVLNQGADPKALDALAESTLKAFPFKPAVSDEEARKYVDEFGGNVDVHKAKYEEMMRKAYGDARYEKVYKARIDATFQRVEDAQRQARAASAPPMGAAGGETQRDANGLVPTRMRNRVDQVGQGVGVANAVKNGDAAGALDGAAKMFPADSKIGSSLAGLSALSKGDPKGAFDAATNLVPNGPVKDGLSFAAKLLFGGSEKG